MDRKLVPLTGPSGLAVPLDPKLEVPGANGQGETKDECLQNLREAIQLMLETEREEVFRLDPQAETAELLLA